MSAFNVGDIVHIRDRFTQVERFGVVADVAPDGVVARLAWSEDKGGRFSLGHGLYGLDELTLVCREANRLDVERPFE